MNKKIAIGSVLPVLLLVMGCEGPAGEAGLYVSISPALASVPVGETITLTVSTENGDEENYTFASSDDDIATVSSGGVVTGVSEGTCLVSVVGASSKASASAIIKVTPESRDAYSFELDVAPMLTSDNFWYQGADACTWCHYANNEEELHSKHVMNLGTWDGIMKGADPPTEDPTNHDGNPLLGQSEPGGTTYDWDHSLLRSRLRNNRMPQSPMWPFMRSEMNRNGPDLAFVDGRASVIRPIKYTNWDDDAVPSAVGLLEAWVEALKTSGNLTNGATMQFTYGGQTGLTFNNDVQQFFTQPSMWFEGSTQCVECHWGNVDESFHLLNLSSYEGFLEGADEGAGPILSGGDSRITSASQIDWEDSRLRHRLRDNRMPPNSPFLLSEENRDGPAVWDPVAREIVPATELIGRWVAAGVPE